MRRAALIGCWTAQRTGFRSRYSMSLTGSRPAPVARCCAKAATADAAVARTCQEVESLKTPVIGTNMVPPQREITPVDAEANRHHATTSDQRSTSEGQARDGNRSARRTRSRANLPPLRRRIPADAPAPAALPAVVSNGGVQGETVERRYHRIPGWPGCSSRVAAR
jgi:hypothetical protein